jgi:branched-chain amino acid transport system substrate-binding protein
MIRRRRAAAAALSATLLLIAACSGDERGTPPTDAPIVTPGPVATDPPVTTSAPVDTDVPVDTTPPEVTEPAPSDGWSVNTDDCADPVAANAPIAGTVHVASVMPLFNSSAAPAFAPVKDGFEAYIQYARQEGLFSGYDDIDLTFEDDKYDPTLTPAAVAKQVAAGADLFSGIIGTKNNEAVRAALNEQCVPQLNALTGSPEWGQVAEFPWTTGILVPYTVETQVYAAQIAQLFPQGATVGVLAVNNDFGRSYVQALVDTADEFHLDLVAAQSVDEADTESPSLQVAAIANATPDAIVATPLGAGCITFLAELAVGRMQHPGWDPAVFITNTCASNLIMAAAGAGADRVYSSDNLLDLTDPAVQTLTAAQQYVAFMTGLGLAASVPSATVGWTTGEVTVAILNQAAASPGGLTRASIIDAARNLDFTPSLARPGVALASHGTIDPFLAESLQVLQYRADTASFVDVGPVVTQFES